MFSLLLDRLARQKDAATFEFLSDSEDEPGRTVPKLMHSDHPSHTVGDSSLTEPGLHRVFLFGMKINRGWPL